MRLLQSGVTRQQFLSGLFASTLTVLPPPARWSASASDTTQVTSKARLSLAVGDAPIRSLNVGLYGGDAPQSVKLFEDMCSGKLGQGLTYSGSTISYIERGKLMLGGTPPGGTGQAVEREIDKTGYVRSKMINRADEYVNADSNALSHDRAGLLSMRRGGGGHANCSNPCSNPVSIHPVLRIPFSHCCYSSCCMVCSINCAQARSSLVCCLRPTHRSMRAASSSARCLNRTQHAPHTLYTPSRKSVTHPSHIFT